MAKCILSNCVFDTMETTFICILRSGSSNWCHYWLILKGNLKVVNFSSNTGQCEAMTLHFEN